jgi:TolB-like protein/Flp pilus assembly protein TadD
MLVMKRCPVCHYTYVDSMSYCRIDGTALVNISTPLAEEEGTLLKLPAHASDAIETGFAGSAAQSNPVTSSSLTMPLQRRRRLSKSRAIDSLAVLPLENVGDDAQLEYLTDGITEGIINSLSQLPKLRVVPRSTVFRYKGRETDPQAAGRELGVRAVLAGRVFQLNELLVIKTELIDVEQESQLWGEQYRRRATDIFTLQEEISQEISEKLRLKLSGEEKKRLGKRYTQNTAAYHFYLQGRYFTNKRTTEWIKKGIEHFQKAIDLDPNYALAHAGLADAYAFLGSSTGERPPTEFYPKTKAAALKALEIDDSLAEAHTSLGFFYMMYEWNFAEARKAFKRAIELNPGYANAHDGYSFYFKATGQHEKAIRECLRAQKVDPLSLFAHVSTAWAYYFARHYEQAIEQNRKALEMDSRFVFAYWNMGLALAQSGRIEESVNALEKAFRYSEGGLTFKAHLGYVHALAGDWAKAQAAITELEELAKERYVPAYYIAIIYLGLDAPEQSLQWLERAREERSGFLAFINVDPVFDSLRADARFRDFAERIGPAA